MIPVKSIATTRWKLIEPLFALPYTRPFNLKPKKERYTFVWCCDSVIFPYSFEDSSLIRRSSYRITCRGTRFDKHRFEWWVYLFLFVCFCIIDLTNVRDASNVYHSWWQIELKRVILEISREVKVIDYFFFFFMNSLTWFLEKLNNLFISVELISLATVWSYLKIDFYYWFFFKMHVYWTRVCWFNEENNEESRRIVKIRTCTILN